MKENFLHFLSDTPGIVSINGKQIGNIDNLNYLGLDVISNTKQVYVSYSPISESKNALPYTVLLSTSDIPTTSNNNFIIVPFPNNNYDIIMFPFFYHPEKETNVLLNKPIGKFFVSVTTTTQTKIIIYSGVTIVFSICLPLFSAVKINENNGLLLIEGLIDDNTYHLLVVDTANFNILYNDTAHSIEDANNQISIYRIIGTMCQHGEVCNIDINNKTTEKYYVFEKEFPYTNFNNILIPHAFLECVKIGDEKTAKLFLADNFQTTTIQQLKEYFGDIQAIYLNRHETSDYKCNYTIKSNNWRNYNFLIDNNKIYDIEEVF